VPRYHRVFPQPSLAQARGIRLATATFVCVAFDLFLSVVRYWGENLRAITVLVRRFYQSSVLYGISVTVECCVQGTAEVFLDPDGIAYAMDFTASGITFLLTAIMLLMLCVELARHDKTT